MEVTIDPNMRKILLAVLSFLIPLIGIYLVITADNQRDKQIYGVAAVLGILVASQILI